ncbi:MAG: FAD:protein FMN transferase [Firmicutes bacterium]|nr:FAD:protein FMN transferase [Bacillota bacterium]
MKNYMRARLFVGVAFLILSIVLIVGYSLNDDSMESHTSNIFAMDTTMTLTAYGENAEKAVSLAQKEIFRLDALLSISGQNSEIAKLNEISVSYINSSNDSDSAVNSTDNQTEISDTLPDAALNATRSLDVSDDTITLLGRAREVSESTGGLFDITISQVMDLWGFRSDAHQVPSPDTLAALVAEIDYTKVQTAGNTVTLPVDTKVDLGGIAKGFASDRVMEIFREAGVTSGIITLGGNVQALGQHPEGRPWNVAIADPFDPNSTFATIKIEDCAAVTSGGYQRNFTENGVTYHHIIDPRTGYPADSGIVSVTIVSPDGTLADGLSTALFIMGLDDASAYWRANSDRFEAVLVTADGTTYVTGVSQTDLKWQTALRRKS